MDLGPHAFFIVAAYAVTFVIVSGLILRAVLDHSAQVRALAELESRGIRRRSEGPQRQEAAVAQETRMEATGRG
jgi:heme exporter protein D